MQTGLKAVDCLVPVGRGQREREVLVFLCKFYLEVINVKVITITSLRVCFASIINFRRGCKLSLINFFLIWFFSDQKGIANRDVKIFSIMCYLMEFLCVFKERKLSRVILDSKILLRLRSYFCWSYLL